MKSKNLLSLLMSAILLSIMNGCYDRLVQADGIQSWRVQGDAVSTEKQKTSEFTVAGQRKGIKQTVQKGAPGVEVIIRWILDNIAGFENKEALESLQAALKCSKSIDDNEALKISLENYIKEQKIFILSKLQEASDKFEDWKRQFNAKNTGDIVGVEQKITEIERTDTKEIQSAWYEKVDNIFGKLAKALSKMEGEISLGNLQQYADLKKRAKVILMLSDKYRVEIEKAKILDYSTTEDKARKLRFQLMVRSMIDADLKKDECIIYNDDIEKEAVNINMKKESTMGNTAIICISENFFENPSKSGSLEVKDTIATLQKKLNELCAKPDIKKEYKNFEIYVDNGFSNNANLQRCVPHIEEKDLKSIAKKIAPDIEDGKQFNIHFISEEVVDGTKDDIKEKVFSKDAVAAFSIDSKIIDKYASQDSILKDIKVDIKKELQGKYIETIEKYRNLEEISLCRPISVVTADSLKKSYDSQYEGMVKGANFEIAVRKYFDTKPEEKLSDISHNIIKSGRKYQHGEVSDECSRECTSLDLEAYIDENNIIDIECKACLPGSALFNTLQRELSNRELHANIKEHFILIDNREDKWRDDKKMYLRQETEGKQQKSWIEKIFALNEPVESKTKKVKYKVKKPIRIFFFEEDAKGFLKINEVCRDRTLAA